MNLGGDGSDTRTAPIAGQRLRPVVSLTALGPAFVVPAVVRELFAVALSGSAGWGWDKGGGSFA